MQTEQIRIKSNKDDMQRAVEEAEHFAHGLGLDEQESMRIELLAEELMGMLRAIMGEFDARFWVERTDDDACQLHLNVTANVDYETKRELISASTTRRNAAAQGFMGKLRDMVEAALYAQGGTDFWQTEYAAEYPMLYGLSSAQMQMSWSLNQYREELEQGRETDSAMEDAWDELEKSMVAKLADDVQVAVTDSRVEITVRRKLPR